jgi:hypothetical protein
MEFDFSKLSDKELQRIYDAGEKGVGETNHQIAQTLLAY